MTTAFHALLLLLHLAPLDRQTSAPWADASTAEAAVRYVEIATAIGNVCDRDSPHPETCSALLVAIAVGESGLARDADIGPCYREGAYRARCDSGAAGRCQAGPGPWRARWRLYQTAKVWAP